MRHFLVIFKHLEANQIILFKASFAFMQGYKYRKTSLISRDLYKILQLFTAAKQRVRLNIECDL